MSEAVRADLSRLHVVIPLRSLAGGKLRLGDVVDAEERETLLLGMLLQEIDIVQRWPACHQLHVVTADAEIADLVAAAGARPVLQPAGGLNEAIVLARGDALAAGATALLVLPADLPYLTREALDRMLEAADAAIAAGSARPIVVIAPSDARGGTNALLLSPPRTIDPSFGPSSLEAHIRNAAAADATVQLVTDDALGFDLDTPEDLERLEPARLAALVELGASRLASAVE
jgi:2-phospho-L-lactate/phosphoenolpyruvate guanylyltransferase